MLHLVACPTCHTQYDVTHIAASTITCRCGEEIENQRFDREMDAVLHAGGAHGTVQGAAILLEREPARSVRHH